MWQHLFSKVTAPVKQQRWLLGGLVYGLLSGTAAWADDTEIYFGHGQQDTTAFVPNILFIMDTSGSMGNSLSSGGSRLDAVKDALTRLLTDVEDVNVGLMRFTNPGGPILYPVRNINAQAEPHYHDQVAAGNDDAFQYHTSNSSIELSQPRLGAESCVDCSGIGVLKGEDDDMEDGSNDFNWGSFGTSTLSWRFHELGIPQGANIISAQLEHTINNNNGDDGAQVTVKGYAVGIAPKMTASDTSELAHTNAAVDWRQPADNLTVGDSIYSPDLSAIIQEIVDRADYTATSPLALIEIPNGGQIDVCSWLQNGCDTVDLPKLTVTWNTGATESTPNNDKSDSGLRFTNVTVPQGSTITDATLILDTLIRPGMGSFTVKAEATDDSSDFATEDLKSRNHLTTASQSWSPNTDHNRIDVKLLVKEVIDRQNWCGGNALSFVIEGDGPSLITAFENNPEQAATLSIRYETSANPGCQSNGLGGDNSKVRAHLIDTVSELTDGGYTPIVDTLYEAANYYLGGSVLHGAQRNPANHALNNPSPYSGLSFQGQGSSLQQRTRISHPLSWTGGTVVRDANCHDDDLSDSSCVSEHITGDPVYTSPITDVCQGNHIVLLSDGLANESHFDSLLQAATGTTCTGDLCAHDLVNVLYDKTQGPNETYKQYSITTHAIGFDSNTDIDNYLNLVAQNGGGDFYTANNADNLVDAFRTIVREAKKTNTTFVAPGVAVNQYNRLSHLDSLFFAVFKPKSNQHWPGNVKRYGFENGKITDVNGVQAVDSVTGFFSEATTSYWSTPADGKEVEAGGAAEFIPGSGRNILSNSGGGISVVPLTTENAFSAADFGLQSGDAVTLDQLLSWLSGQVAVDGSTDARQQMGDPLHASPVLVDYGSSENHKLVVFVPTNEGVLHALEVTNFGAKNELDESIESVVERFAFIPHELLPNTKLNFENKDTISRAYGLDGDITVRIDDNGNKTLYFGMRRGGYSYYALDVTTLSAPQLKFVIRGGAGGDADFTKLGQSWSQPVLTKVKIGSTVKNVLLFAGGYDTAQDSHKTRQADAIGNAVYMVDADTGDRLWWASSDSGSDTPVSAMTNSLPARLSVIDRNGDGLADLFYAVDTGGRLFRFDIYQGKSAGDLVKGNLIADLGDSADPGVIAENRRFYHAPDIALIPGSQPYYAVTVGSGYRAHPLDNTTNDRFYMIKDHWALTLDNDGNYSFPGTAPEASGLPNLALSHSELYDATTYLGHFSGSMSEPDQEALETAYAALYAKHGWFVSLPAGEKVLSSPLILNQKVMFSTYVPAVQSNATYCVPQEGSGRLFLMDLLTANAVADINNASGEIVSDGALDAHDRVVNLRHAGIPPQPRLIFPNPTTPTVCIGTECYDASDDGTVCAGVECLTENLLGSAARVRRATWNTLVEASPPSEANE